MTDKTPGQEGYWSALEDYEADGGDVEELSAVALIDEELRDLDEPEELVGALATGVDESRDRLYVLVASKKDRNGHVILTLRYAFVDRDELEARLSSNQRIRMRVQGSLVQALPVLFAAVRDGAASPDDPQLLDARSVDGVDHNGGILRADLSARVREESDEESESGRSRSVDESVDRHAGAEHGSVVCQDCGRRVDRSEAANLGGALGQDYWVHMGACPDDEGGESA